MTAQEYTRDRKDLQVDLDPDLGAAIAAQLTHNALVSVAEASVHMPVRASLLEPTSRDPNGLERVIGRSDLTSVNYFARGLEAAQAVCRIRVPDGQYGWYGTGFLCGRALLVTNHHVLSSEGEAAQAEAEFGFEHDLEGVLQEPVGFNLTPHDIFFTDAELDITIVSVAPFSSGGVPIERYGRLPLLPLSGKGVAGEAVTIPQHPGGMPKQMSIRNNQIVELNDDHSVGIDTSRFIHYRSDTEPGSSGAPVLNDQWQVVAVHHRAIPHPDTDPQAVRDDDADIVWIANEGVRVSAVWQRLEYLRFSDRSVAKALERIEDAIGLRGKLPPETTAAANAGEERDARPYNSTKWQEWSTFSLGYDPEFLPVRIDADAILGERLDDAAVLVDGSGVFLDYLHFSTVIHKTRGFPILTAVNVRGDKLIHPGKRPGSWRTDSRLDLALQPAGNFYEKNRGNDPVQFSRGHLVRQLDPCWGETDDEAKVAQLHTFHYTNAAPQVQGFNSGDWLDIEDYVLNRAQTTERRVSLFSGPVFRDCDPVYGRGREGGPWQIPLTYWKVAVMEKPDGSVTATAFLQGQTKFVEALAVEAKVFSLRRNTIADLQSENLQTTLAVVEAETGLDFGELKDHDATNALESTRRSRLLRSFDDIVF